MYNRHPVLPVDIKYSLNGTDETSENDQPFNMEVFNAILSSTLSLREEAHQEVSKNIAKAQRLKKSSKKIITADIQCQRHLRPKIKFG